MTTKTCGRCNQEKTLSDFNRDRHRPEGYSYHCRACRRGINRHVYTLHRPNAKEGKPKGSGTWNTPEQRRERSRLYRINDRARNAEYAARRRAQKGRATPPWAEAEIESIRGMYREAKRLTEETGVMHHVDHIVPLQNKIVSGLHCLANLQILEGEENIRKNNTFSDCC